MADRTVFRVLEEAAEVYGYAPALHQPYTENGKRKVRTLSWVAYRAAAEEIAAGLRTLGIRKGNVVALDSETRLEFYLADLGIMANGSIAAALYPSYPPKELVRTIQACDAKALFAEDPKTLESAQGFARRETHPFDWYRARRHPPRSIARMGPRRHCPRSHPAQRHARRGAAVR